MAPARVRPEPRQDRLEPLELPLRPADHHLEGPRVGLRDAAEDGRLDPLASGRGDPLSDGETLRALREALMPRVTVATPNSMEARRLALAAPGAALSECAQQLAALGCKYVLITGTHEPGTRVTNTLFGANGKLREDAWPRMAGEYHGSGCTLASALAAMLAKGLAVPEAVRAAQDYTWNALQAGYRLGRGQAVPDRFFASR